MGRDYGRAFRPWIEGPWGAPHPPPGALTKLSREDLSRNDGSSPYERRTERAAPHRIARFDQVARHAWNHTGTMAANVAKHLPIFPWI
jgi:hypothetical protein